MLVLYSSVKYFYKIQIDSQVVKIPNVKQLVIMNKLIYNKLLVTANMFKISFQLVKIVNKIN